MKTSGIKRFVAHLAGVTLFLYIPLEAATLAVLPGESIQAQIDAAAEGDVIAIFGGTYDQNVTVNKSVRLAEVEGEEVTITGNITFTGLTDPPPFAGFKTGSGSGGGRIYINGVTGLLVDDIDSTAGVAIEISNNSDVLIRGGQHRALSMASGVVEIHSSQFIDTVTQNGGELEIYSTTIGGNFDTADAATKTLAFRTQVSGDCNWRSNRSWFAYSKARSFNFYGSNDKVVVVGSQIDRVQTNGRGILLEGSNNAYSLFNNCIKGVRGCSQILQVRGGGHIVRVFNNYLEEHGYCTYSIEIHDSTNVRIFNNIISGDNVYLIYAPAGVILKNNLIANGSTWVDGGAIAQGTLSGDPLFVDGDPYTLAEGSPCIDAGVEDARYNDLDGTRNDIGPSGGAAWDPEGWTTENPVMIAFDLSTDQLIEGQTTSIELSEAFGVSAP